MPTGADVTELPTLALRPNAALRAHSTLLASFTGIGAEQDDLGFFLTPLRKILRTAGRATLTLLFRGSTLVALTGPWIGQNDTPMGKRKL